AALTASVRLLPPSVPATAIIRISLHGALPIAQARTGRRTSAREGASADPPRDGVAQHAVAGARPHEATVVPPRPSNDEVRGARRSEEHTSELQSRENLVCRLLLEKKNIAKRTT